MGSLDENERFFPPKRLGDHDVKKVSVSQTSEGDARLAAKKRYHFLLMGTCL